METENLHLLRSFKRLLELIINSLSLKFSSVNGNSDELIQFKLKIDFSDSSCNLLTSVEKSNEDGVKKIFMPIQIVQLHGPKGHMETFDLNPTNVYTIEDFSSVSAWLQTLEKTPIAIKLNVLCSYKYKVWNCEMDDKWHCRTLMLLNFDFLANLYTSTNATVGKILSGANDLQIKLVIKILYYIVYKSRKNG